MLNTPKTSAVYSSDLDAVLEQALEGNSRFFVVLCLGLSREAVHELRGMYLAETSANWASLMSNLRETDPVPVRIAGSYGEDRPEVVLDATPIIPSLIVLAPGFSFSPYLLAYVREHRVPMVRITEKPTHIADLPRMDYYNGVCATLCRDDLYRASVVSSVFDYAFLVNMRLHDQEFCLAQDRKYLVLREGKEAESDSKLLALARETGAFQRCLITAEDETSGFSEDRRRSDLGSPMPEVVEARVDATPRRRKSDKVRAGLATDSPSSCTV